MLDFVNIEQQEAGFIPFGTNFSNPDFGRVAEALGATVRILTASGRLSIAAPAG